MTRKEKEIERAVDRIEELVDYVNNHGVFPKASSGDKRAKSLVTWMHNQRIAKRGMNACVFHKEVDDVIQESGNEMLINWFEE